VDGQLTDLEYRRLLEFRVRLRQFLHWSEGQAVAAGLTPAQHQLLLAIRGSRDPQGPTIGEVAETLLLRHHSTVGLIDRAVSAGLARRRIDHVDQRVVRLELTSLGRRRLGQISRAHLQELERLSVRGEGVEPSAAFRPHRAKIP